MHVVSYQLFVASLTNDILCKILWAWTVSEICLCFWLLAFFISQADAFFKQNVRTSLRGFTSHILLFVSDCAYCVHAKHIAIFASKHSEQLDKIATNQTQHTLVNKPWEQTASYGMQSNVCVDRSVHRMERWNATNGEKFKDYSRMEWSHYYTEAVIQCNLIILIPVFDGDHFLPHDAMLSAVYAVVVCLSICVCHTPVLYQNG